MQACSLMYIEWGGGLGDSNVSILIMRPEFKFYYKQFAKEVLLAWGDNPSMQHY